MGIDVGGARKGFHAVALRDGAYAGQLANGDVQELAHWCRSVVGARVIAIDAPCRWSSDGRSRSCERELMRRGIFCFATPASRRPNSTPAATSTGCDSWLIDAALCTLTAHRVASGAVCLASGESNTSLIVVPERPGPPGETSLDRPD